MFSPRAAHVVCLEDAGPLSPGARVARPRKNIVFGGKMREAHFPTKHKKSGARRRREQAIVMAIRQTQSIDTCFAEILTKSCKREKFAFQGTSTPSQTSLLEEHRVLTPLM